MAYKGRRKRGSAGYRRRSRFKGQIRNIKTWGSEEDKVFKGIYGFKIGMTTYEGKYFDEELQKEILVRNRCTLIECPPLKAVKLFSYSRSLKGLVRKEIKKEEDLGRINRALVNVNHPHMEKNKDLFLEIEINIPSHKEGKELLEKEVDIFSQIIRGAYYDLTGITKGKGFQGAIKRYGVTRLSHKNSKKIRAVATQGTKRPGFTRGTTPARGQLGYFQRSFLNSHIIGVIPASEIKTPFHSYGLRKNRVIILHGSVPGPVKRIVLLKRAVRNKGTKEISYKLLC